MRHTLFLYVFVAYLCQNPVHLSVLIPPQFVLKGNDVHLDVNNVTEDFLLLIWKFKKGDDNLVTFSPGKQPIVSKNYKGRVHFSDIKNYTVILKNLQESDSGEYFARMSTDQDKELAQYNIIVQDSVVPVNLKVESVSKSSDSCNVTVTCSTVPVDSFISTTFRCVDQTCHQDGGEQSKITNPHTSLQIYLSDVTLICNHSNQVSWTKDMTDIQQHCPRYNKNGAAQHPPYKVVLWVLIPIVIIIIAAVILYCYRKRSKQKCETIDNTVYAVPLVPATQSPDENNTNVYDPGLSPTSTYARVGPHSAPLTPSETADRTLPESMYAKIERVSKH